MTDNHVLRQLLEISTRAREGFDAQAIALLDVGLRYFGLETGALIRVGRHGLEVRQVLGDAPEGLAAGAHLVLPGVDDGWLPATGHAFSAVDASRNGADPMSRALAERWNLAAVIGETVAVENEPYGILVFASSAPRTETFTPDQLDVMDAMAKWLGSELWRLDQEERLRVAEERFRKGVEASPAGILMVEGDGLVTYANAQALAMFDYEEEALVGQPIEILVPAASRVRHVDARRRFTHDHGSRGIGIGHNLEAVRRDGTVFQVEVGLTPIDTADGTRVLCTVLDLTERLRFEKQILDQAERLRRINQSLAEQAITDTLTGLANRRGLEAQMEAILRLGRRRRQPTSLLMLDVDRFKDYNDTFGHPAGDVALKEVARVLQDTARRSDIVARFGGEEFVVLLPETSWEGAQDVAERIRLSVSELTTLKRRVTVSIGIATRGGLEGGVEMVNGVHATGDRLIREADEALYAAKQGGRNRVVGFGVG